MTRQAQELLQAALVLPAHDRADVAAELLASLHDRPEAEQREVEEAVLWYDEQRAGLGSALLDAIDLVLEHFSRWPDAAPLVPRRIPSYGVPASLRQA